MNGNRNLDREKSLWPVWSRPDLMLLQLSWIEVGSSDKRIDMVRTLQDEERD